MAKKKFLIEVTIDNDKLEKKYPNYHINYDNAEQFAKAMAHQINQPKYGYKAKLIKKL